MFNKRRTFIIVSIGVIAAFILSSCSTPTAPATQVVDTSSPDSSNQSVAASEVPTNGAVDTATPTPSLVATATLVATPIAAATATSTPSSPAQVVPNINPYCRKGPADGYDAITFLTKGTAYPLLGRDSAGYWWQIQAPGNVSCWVPSSTVATQGSVDQVAVVNVPPLPTTPGNFVNTYVCTATKSLAVTLSWDKATNATGYRLFRNGTPLVTLKSNEYSYIDNGPLGVKLVYELEAFNDYGVAARTSASVPACK